MNRFTKIFTSQYFLAFVTSIFIILLLPTQFQNKYEAEIKKSWRIDKKDGVITYCDLDNDGYSEQITIFESRKKEPAIKVINHLGGIVDWWDFDGTFPEGKPSGQNILTGDYNNNGLKEIYFFTQYGDDSVFLNILEAKYDSVTFLKQKFITTVNKVDTVVDYIVELNILKDINNDKYKDLIFRIGAGFSLQPRAIYIYDIHNDVLMNTPPSGCLKYRVNVVDLNNDGLPEFVCKTSSPGNIPDSMGIPYSDHHIWLMVFDNKLNYLFKPVGYYGNPGGVSCRPYNTENGTFLFTLFKIKDKRGIINKIALFDINGNKIKERDISEMTKKGVFLFKTKKKNNDFIFLINENGKIYRVTDSLKLSLYKDVKYPISLYLKKTDLNNDKKEELIFRNSEKNEITILQNDFDYPVTVKVPPDSYYPKVFSISIKKNGAGSPELFVQNGALCYLIGYYNNPLFYLRYPFYIAIYLLTLLFIAFIQKVQDIRQRKHKEIENKISKLQFVSIKGQLDPHFTFNALNSISSLILKEEKETAYKFITKFSDLIRATVENYDVIDIPLEKELDFIQNYLELQKFRFKDGFDYKIEIAPGTNTSVLIPQMLIQNFVENAVKHGLKFKEKEGLLNIKVETAKRKLIITIEDNGIGREKAKMLSKGSTGKGLKIIDNILNLYLKLKNVKITYTITDLYDKNNNAAGTKVVVKIPLSKTDKN